MIWCITPWPTPAPNGIYYQLTAFNKFRKHSLALFLWSSSVYALDIGTISHWNTPTSNGICPIIASFYKFCKHAYHLILTEPLHLRTFYRGRLPLEYTNL